MTGQNTRERSRKDSTKFWDPSLVDRDLNTKIDHFSKTITTKKIRFFFFLGGG